jgi:diguanylate cyclase (GGDEF)-like protein
LTEEQGQGMIDRMPHFTKRSFGLKTQEGSLVEVFLSAELSFLATTSLMCFFLLLTGYLDFLTGANVSFTLFYIFPVFLATWFSNRKLGLVASGLSVTTSFLADHFDGIHYVSGGVAVWTGFSRLAIFTLFAFLISAVRRLWINERTLAATDLLTGLPNRRWFLKILEYEFHRHRRLKEPLALAMLDLDNFKAVNDRFGHAEGDRLLIQAGKTLQKSLRGADLAARLGGDEFAVLFPLVTLEGAQPLAQKLFKGLNANMQENNWPVSVSLGMVTCLDFDSGSDALLLEADRLLYLAKNGGKNSVECSVMVPREQNNSPKENA